MIHRELCKRLKFDHTDRLYKYKPEFILKNELHKILWEIKTDHPTQTRWPDSVLINKKKEFII